LLHILLSILIKLVSKKRKSKVKPIVIPGGSSPRGNKADSEIEGSTSKKSSPPPPPPTPIKVLQKIGINICGIPAEELEVSKLQKEKSHEEEEAEASDDDAI
jgi:hypothetical protein